jgi:hypothetical protein
VADDAFFAVCGGGDRALGRTPQLARCRCQSRSAGAAALSPGCEAGEAVLACAGQRKAALHAVQALFGKLYARCLRQAPRHGFRFKNKLYSLDSSLIDLSLKVFPWVHYALGKAAMNNRNHSAKA